MRKEISLRVLKETEYFLKNNQTIRDLATIFQVSKSTIHKDLSERLKEIDSHKYELVKKVLERHLRERHLKGGQSTKNKYQKLK